MPKNFFLQQNLIIQAVSWPLYYLFMLWINYHVYPDRTSVEQLMALLMLFVIFNACVAIFYLFFMSKWGWLGVPLVGLVFWLSAELVFVGVYKIMPQLNVIIFREELTNMNDSFYWRMLNRYFGVLVLAAALVLHVKSKLNALLKQKEEKLKHEKELEARESELAFLAAQINPHFLYNVLNNIQQACILKMPRIAMMLGDLADLLKYTVYNASQRVKKVVIEKEMDALEKYIHLEKTRFDQCFVFYEVRGEACGQKIPPGILITIVENAFKYGICRQEDKPINILLDLFDDEIVFTCRNWIDPANQEGTSTGVGLKNIQYRLEMMFQGRYLLKIDDTEAGIYQIKLLIYQN